MSDDKLRLAWRIGQPMSMPDEGFERMRKFLLEHREVVDEIAFFETISHHLYLPLEFYENVAATFKRRIATLKNDGVLSVGINVLTTIGHVNEGWDIFEPLPFQAMVGHDGSVSKSCACPNSLELRAYVAGKYTLFAKAEPDFIWIDDDIRMAHHGVDYPCFCPTCLEILSNTLGRKFDRDGLVAELNEPQAAALRQAWIEQNVQSIERLLAHVKKTIHCVDPGIRTGLMTAGPGWTTYSPPAGDRWFTALGASKARPGGGFYTDERPIEMLGKAYDIGRQCALVPDEVSDCQYELENFPYAPLRKGLKTVINECSLAIAAGCNGIAFNALGGDASEAGLAGKEPLLRRIVDTRRFWERLNKECEGRGLMGFWPAWHPHLMARRSVREGEDWFASSPFYDIRKPEVLSRLGLPLGTGRRGNGAILAGRVAEGFNDEELREMLAGPVLMDAFALEVLAERGLDDLAGVRILAWTDNGMAERFTDDPLNAPMEGALRDIRSEFWGDPYMKSARLALLSPDVRVLSVLETYLGKRHEPCVTAYENSLGGRVIVMGHAPWRFVEAKQPQIMNAADWTTAGTLPVRIREIVPVVPMVRLAEDRTRGVILLVNSGLDSVDEVTLEVRAPETKVSLAGPERESRRIETIPTANGWSVVVGDIGAWEVVALFLGDEQV